MISDSLALAALLGALAITSITLRLDGPIRAAGAKRRARPSDRAFVLRTKLLRILAFGFNLSRKDGGC